MHCKCEFKIYNNYQDAGDLLSSFFLEGNAIYYANFSKEEDAKIYSKVYDAEAISLRDNVMNKIAITAPLGWAIEKVIPQSLTTAIIGKTGALGGTQFAIDMRTKIGLFIKDEISPITDVLVSKVYNNREDIRLYYKYGSLKKCYIQKPKSASYGVRNVASTPSLKIIKPMAKSSNRKRS